MANQRFLIPLAFGAAVAAAQADDIVQKMADNLGVDEVQTLRYEADGSKHMFGQSPDAGAPWPELDLTRYNFHADYAAGALREESIRPEHLRPHQIEWLSEGHAWTQFGKAPPLPGSAEDKELQLLMTPVGFARAALQADPEVSEKTVGDRTVSTIRFTTDGHQLEGHVDENGLLRRVEAKQPHALYGDMQLVAQYDDYKQWNGLQYPTDMLVTQAGHPVLDIAVSKLETNVPLEARVPQLLKVMPKQMPPPQTQQLGDGIWLIKGSHNSVAVEFDDFITVIEAPLNEQRSEAVIAKVKELIPGKPIEYLVSTHHHWDHASGLRTYVAEGATIVTHESTEDMYRALLTAEHTLKPDRQSREQQPLKLELVDEEPVVISDGERRLEAHHIQNDPHASSMIFAWLPQSGMVVEGDVYNPFPGRPPEGSNLTRNFYENLQRLELDVETVVPVHGVVTSGEDLAAAANNVSSSH